MTIKSGAVIDRHDPRVQGLNWHIDYHALAGGGTTWHLWIKVHPQWGDLDMSGWIANWDDRNAPIPIREGSQLLMPLQATQDQIDRAVSAYALDPQRLDPVIDQARQLLLGPSGSQAQAEFDRDATQFRGLRSQLAAQQPS